MVDTKKHQVTLHQGAIEQIFFDSLASMGVSVDRPMTPIFIQLSDNVDELKDPTSHPVKVYAALLTVQ